MAKIWEQNQGHSARRENKKNYERFKAFLKLGSERDFPKLAQQLGLTRQAVGYIARTYNWAERAAAWDLEKNKNKPVVSELPSKPPSEVPQIIENITEAIETEVMADILQTNQAKLQYNRWIEYQEKFCAVGKEMLDDADEIRKLALLCHSDLEILWNTRLTALKAKDFATAAVLCMQIKDLTPQYWKLRELVRGHRQDARLHWGDAIGVKSILDLAYKAKDG